VSGSHAHRRVATPAAALLAAVLLAGLAPTPAARAAEPEPAAVPDEQPSTAYLESMAHEHDEIDFEPGGRVRVAFAPRASDRWSIDGKAPRALPAGLASGVAMAAVPQGRAWVEEPGAKDPGGGDPRTDASVDAPAGDAAVNAHGVAWTPAVAAQVAGQDARSGLRRQVFGFLPYWELSGASSQLDYDVLSTIAYFSVGVNGRGDLKKRDPDGSLTTGWAGWTSASMTNVIDQAHARGTRVVLSITAFAWTSAQARVQRSILGSKANRDNLARQAAAAVRDRGADGINLDFEPLAAGYSDEFVAFLKSLRSELNRVGGGYQLTYDTTGSIGNYPLEASVGRGVADAIFVMGYDYRTGGASSAGSIDPLSGPRYDLTDTVRAYTARVSPSRIILGLPWYGRAWSTTTSAVNAPTRDNGTKYGHSTAVNYESLTDLVDQHGRRWDPVEQSPYVVYKRENCTPSYGCVTTWRQLYYDDAASLKLRLEMVDDHDLRGAGMWALGYDDGRPELYRAYAKAFAADTTGPATTLEVAPGVFSPNGDGALETIRLAWTTDERATGRVRIYHGDTLIRAWGVADATSWEGTWNGRDADGAAVPDGRYMLRTSLRDAAGNIAWASTRIVVDRTAGRLAWDRHFFPQDGDSLRADATLSWRLTRDATTTLKLFDADGTRVLTAWSDRAQRAGTRSWTWDGRTDDGTFAPQGAYAARLTVTSPLGTTTLWRSVHAGGFTAIVNASRVGPGDTLRIRFRNVEPHSTRPTVAFRQPGRPAVKVTATRLADGSYRAVFRVAAGDTGTGRLTIAATDQGGGRNLSTIPVTVTR
jgi:spore germination protein YaaH